MIVSPSQDSFYNGFPGYSQFEDSTFPSFPNPLLNAIPQDSSPVIWPPSTFQGISSRVKTSQLITCPSEEEEDKEEEEEDGGRDSPESHTLETRSKSNSGKQTLQYTSFSDSNIETITELDVETESPENRIHRSPHLRRGYDAVGGHQSKEAQRLLMQESIACGMQGIMSKVVNETKHNSPGTRKPHSRSNTAPSSLHIPMGEYKAPATIFHKKMQVRPLICSPMTSTTDLKRYPNFVFTPAASKNNVNDQKSQSHKHGSDGRERKDNHDTSREEEDNWFGDDVNNKGLEDSWLGNGMASSREEGVFNNDESWVDNNTNEGNQETRSFLEKRNAIISRLPLDDGLDSDATEVGRGWESAVGSNPEPNSNHHSSERDLETRKSLFHTIEVKEDPMIPEVVIMKAKPSRFFEAPTVPALQQHYHSTKSLISTPTSDPLYQTQMELVKPLSALLNHKFIDTTSKRQPLKSSLKNSVSTNDLNVTVTVNAGDNSSLGLRRSCTDVPVGRTSVTKLKRPHSFHVSKRLSKDGGVVDFTKDEFIRSVALQGMTKKPRSRQPSQDGPTPPYQVIPSKAKEVVSDLDALLLLRKASNVNTTPKGPTKGTTEVTTGKSSRKYWLEKRRSKENVSGSISSADACADLDKHKQPLTKKRHSYGGSQLRFNTGSYNSKNGEKSAFSKSHSATELNGVHQGRKVGRAAVRIMVTVEGAGEDKKREEKVEGMEERMVEDRIEGKEGRIWEAEEMYRGTNVEGTVERRMGAVEEKMESNGSEEEAEERTGTEKTAEERREAVEESNGSREEESKGRKAKERNGGTQERKIGREETTEERRVKVSNGSKEEERNEWTGDRNIETEEVTVAEERTKESAEQRRKEVSNGEKGGSNSGVAEAEEKVWWTAEERQIIQGTEEKNWWMEEMGEAEETAEEVYEGTEEKRSRVIQDTNRETSTEGIGDLGGIGRTGRETICGWNRGTEESIRRTAQEASDKKRGEAGSVGIEEWDRVTEEGVGGTAHEGTAHEGRNSNQERGELESARKNGETADEWRRESSLKPQSAPVTPGDYQEAAYIIQHEPEKLCWTQF